NWQDKWYDTSETGGAFKRKPSSWRHWVSADAASEFPAESGRYHLYVSLACPWAHRTLIFRKLKGLEDHISVSVVHPLMLGDGWTFDADFPGATGDTLLGKKFLRDVYLADDPKASTRVTVPVLWDKTQGKIVNNESAEIIRMMNSEFNQITGNGDDYWPQEMRLAIEPVNERIYEGLNNGVYRAGFATTQKAYDAGVADVFDTLDWLEARLDGQCYLMGERLTEADWRLFTTLARFDAVYVQHFKCDRHRLIDYPNIWDYAKRLYGLAGVAETVDFDHIRNHYFRSHPTINPHGIMPTGPDVTWTE
ncbi:MAG: glutathione S-transferase family protein, partial [Deltaproteobacteria bacterium]